MFGNLGDLARHLAFYSFHYQFTGLQAPVSVDDVEGKNGEGKVIPNFTVNFSIR